MTTIYDENRKWRADAAAKLATMGHIERLQFMFAIIEEWPETAPIRCNKGRGPYRFIFKHVAAISVDSDAGALMNWAAAVVREAKGRARPHDGPPVAP